MLRRIRAQGLSDLFLPVKNRNPAGFYWIRISDDGDAVRDFLRRYDEAARASGVVLSGSIPNPDERQLNYYQDILGSGFSLDLAFIQTALQKWLPRMQAGKRTELTQALFDQLTELRQAGKSDSIIKNIYIKMMCWLYYRFERLAPLVGQDPLPKVLYEGSSITRHEWMFLRIIGALGADIVLLEPQGDDAYLKLDSLSKASQKMAVPSPRPFPADFSMNQCRKEWAAEDARRRQAAAQSPRPAVPPRPAAPRPAASPVPQRPAQAPNAAPKAPSGPEPFRRFPAPDKKPCTNAWMTAADVNQLLTAPPLRGSDPKLYYNALIRLTGVRDKITYANELYQLYQSLLNAHRQTLVLDGPIPQPEPEELNRIRRHTYRSAAEMAWDLAGNLPASAQLELQQEMRAAFMEVLEKAASREKNLNRLLVQAVYLLCWIQRYQGQLFRGWKTTDIPCLIKMGPCLSEAETIYISFVSLLPADVLILAPDLNQVCLFEDQRLLELKGTESISNLHFPRQAGTVQMQTAASYAEQDLTGALYTNSGLYRNRQFAQADAIVLQTTYDELSLYWDQELKYRPSFSTTDALVNLPVLYAKVSGVEQGKLLPYWQQIKLLSVAPDTKLFTKFPIIPPGNANGCQALAVRGIKNGRLQRDVLRSDRKYPFGLLRQEMQEHILDKVQLMLDQRLIQGTFKNGTEYTVLSTVLNLNQELLRMIQRFDFTKKNPKFLIVHTTDQSPSLEDAVLLTFLSLVGFDILIFVPTGYQMTERYLNDHFPVEHQIGEYMYDLRIPDFSSIHVNKGPQWLQQLLKRGI